MKPFHCRHCNRPITMTYGLCHDCADRVYRSNSLFLPSLSKKQRYTKTQKPICIICGKVCSSLSIHVAHSHKMSIKEYKKKFKLKEVRNCKVKFKSAETERRFMENLKKFAESEKKHLTRTQKSDTIELENKENNASES